MAFKSALLLALASTASALMISPEPLTHNQAKMFCATQKSRLADVTSDNRDHVIGQLAGKDAWIGSWDFNFYSGQCMYFSNGHIGAVDCEEKKIAICNDPVVYKSTRDVQDAQDAQVEEVAEMGARPSRRHCPKPCAKPCEREECVPCVPNCGYEYVYLTQTVSKVYTSVELTTSYTSTITVPNFTATVAAYVVTSATA